MATRTPVRRRTARRVCDQVAVPVAKEMKVAVAAVVEMPGTWSDRMAFICKPSANALWPTRMLDTWLDGEVAIQTVRKPTCTTSATLSAIDTRRGHTWKT